MQEKPKQLTAEDIQVGKCYRGRGYDRFVLWISRDRKELQYDSDAVKDRDSYPRISMERFLKWAKCEVWGER